MIHLFLSGLLDEAGPLRQRPFAKMSLICPIS